MNETSPANLPTRQQKTLELQPAFQHHGDQSVTVHGVMPNNPPQRISGRCCLYINAGSATIRLNPTPAEMRALAALLTAAADTERAQ